MLLTLLAITVITNTSNMTLIEKVDYELRRHLFIEDIYYKFRSDIYSILKIDYNVSDEVLFNDLNIYKVGDRLVVESDSEIVLNYLNGHIYSIDNANNTVRVSIDRSNIIEYRELNTLEVKMYDLIEIGDIIGTSKYDSFKGKYYYEIYVIKGDIDYIYENML